MWLRHRHKYFTAEVSWSGNEPPSPDLAHSNDLSTAIITEIHGETDPLPRASVKSGTRSWKESVGGAAEPPGAGEQSPRATSQGRLPVDSVGTPHPWGALLSHIHPGGDEYVDNYAWIHIPGEGVQSPGPPKMPRVFSYCYCVSI